MTQKAKILFISLAIETLLKIWSVSLAESLNFFFYYFFSPPRSSRNGMKYCEKSYIWTLETMPGACGTHWGLGASEDSHPLWPSYQKATVT